MDKIVLTPDELDKLTYRTLKAMQDIDKKMYVSLPNFTLALEHIRITFKNENGVLQATYINTEDQSKATFGFTAPVFKWNQIIIPDGVVFTKNNDECIKNFIQSKCDKPYWLDHEGDFYMYQNIFLNYDIIQKSLLCLPNVWRKNKEVPSKKKIPTKIYDTHNVTLRNVYTLNSQHVEFRNYETYTCECWGVRGHVRHYKDGREVFVKPYKKGIKKDLIPPKGKNYTYENSKD